MSISTSTPISESLTEKLLESNPEAFQKAIQAEFLTQAGKGTLPKKIPEKWLAQDRLYAQAYVRFAGLLLANVQLLPTVSPVHINEQLADLILDSLTNIHRELKFFEDVAKRYGLNIDAGDNVSKGVEAYRKLFFETGESIENGTISFLEGMVLLWGTEKCYLQSWFFAATNSLSAVGIGAEKDSDGGASRKEFIPNWTSPEFVVFVEKIEKLLNRLWAGDSGFVARIEVRENKEELVERCTKLWNGVLDAERVFWPDI